MIGLILALFNPSVVVIKDFALELHMISWPYFWKWTWIFIGFFI